MILAGLEYRWVLRTVARDGQLTRGCTSLGGIQLRFEVGCPPCTATNAQPHVTI
jgi:hypothetical protein